MGKNKQPYYRIVVTDKRSPRNGKFIEVLGYYHPLQDNIKVSKEKVEEWIKKGAQLSERVKEIFKKQNIII
jgi:small subunit ribosomal protein S16